ncbi:MAG: nucleotidyltransferase family protein [Candidatus Omnitrophota bacterium]|jgi:glucose-1-phosphate thymidylyltransferase
MKVLILAAGYGVRLHPLTLNKPKALLEVGSSPILTRICEKIASIKECDGIFIVTNAKFFNAIEAWSKQLTLPFKIQVINDGTTSNEDRLGAIGDMSLALERMKVVDDILLIAGDNLFEFNINHFCHFAQDKSPHISVALYDVKDKTLAKQYGIVSIDSTAKIIEFIEKPQMPKSTLASTGLYFIPRTKVAKVKEYMKIGITQDALGNFIKWIARQEPVYGYVFTEGWFDIGSLEALKKAEEHYADTQK